MRPRGLRPRSRAPHHSGRAMPEEIAAGDRRAAVRAAELGSEEAAGGAGRTAPGGDVAGAVEHRRAAAPRRAERGATAARGLAGGPAICPGGGAERPVVHRLQGLVPHSRRGAVRSADHHRRRQPLLAGMPDLAADAGRGAAGGRPGVSRLRSAAGDAQRQRRAVRFHRRRRPVAPGGALGQARHPARAHRARSAAAERPARAHARHAEGGNGAATGGQRRRAAGPV